MFRHLAYHKHNGDQLENYTKQYFAQWYTLQGVPDVDFFRSVIELTAIK